MKIRKLDREAIPDAVNLVKEVFFQEGNLGYTREGAKSFLEFLDTKGDTLSWIGAYDPDLTGVIAYLEEKHHISLFFVRKSEQRRGIGSALIHALAQEMEQTQTARITVNAADQAVAVYEALGFEKTGEEQDIGGIVFVPMEYLTGRQNLGKPFTVIVEHEIGTYHPHLADVQYPMNYGYIDEIVKQTGEFQDACVYGVTEPAEVLHGKLAGIVYRKDQDQTLWIISEEEKIERVKLVQLLGETEQYFDTHIVLMNETGV